MTGHINPEHLRRLTDSDEMLPRFRRMVEEHWPNSSLVSVSASRVMPKKSGEVVIQYDLFSQAAKEDDAAPPILFAQYVPAGMPIEDAMVERFVWMDDLRLRLWLFPNDPELDHIGLLFNRDGFHRAFDDELENVGFDRVAMGTRTVLLGYRLGRRCVVRVRWQDRPGTPPPQSPKNDIVIKMGRPLQALGLWTRWRQLEHEGFGYKSSDGICMPKSLFLHHHTGALFQDYVASPSLHALIGTSGFVDGCRAAAMTLDKLHRSHVSGLDTYTAEDAITHLQWLVGATGRVFPDIIADLRMRLEELECNRPITNRRDYVTSHRDFYDKQLLSGSSRSVLLDCDTLALADPALDYGNFVAHLRWRMSQHPECAASIERGIERFTESYMERDGSFYDRVSWWTAATFLRLACLYTWRPRWRQHAPILTQLDRHTTRAALP